MTGRRQRGFTLVEVMLALGILFAGLVVLIQSTAGNIYTADRSYMLGVATNLARAKMYDLEEQMLLDGFSELDEEESGDFSDQGWPTIRWEAQIIRPEIPDLASMAQALQQQGAEGEGDSAETDDRAGGMGGGVGGGLGLGSGAGGEQGEASAGGLASLIPPFLLRMLQNVLEKAIRKVELTVTWNTAKGEESMLVEAYVTEPKAVNEVVGGLGGAGGGGAGGEGGEDGTGDGGEGGGGEPRRGGDLRERQ